MPNPFINANEVDVEAGAATPASQAGNYFGDARNSTPHRQTRSPFDPRTVGQVRFGRGAGPTTARLRRVSTSILAAGRRDDELDFGDGIGASGGRTASDAPPKSTKQLRKFVRDVPVDDADMLTIDVTLRKEDYGAPGSSDFRKNQAFATAGLHEKFGVARHKIVSGAEEGDQAKSAHVQQVIVGILHRITEGQQRSKAMDFMDVCTVSGLGGNLESDNPRDWWDGTEIDIWEDWDLITEGQMRRWQYSVNKYFSDEDRIASNWLQIFVYNSSTDSLKTAVSKKYKKLPADQRGGPMYLWLTLCEMFHMSREVKDAMLKFLDIFKRNGVSRYTGENVLVVSEEIMGVCKRLDAAKALTYDHVIEILMGLSICTNKRFRDMFDHLKKSAELDNLHILDTISIDATPMEQIEAILDKAVNTYDKLCTAQVWNKTTRGGPSALNSIVQEVAECWNCGGKGHQAKDCSKQRNPEVYKKNFEAWKSSRGDTVGSRGGRGSQRRSGRNGNGGRGSGGDSNTGKIGNIEYNRKTWEAQHFSLVDGKLHVYCKKCGPNTTHSTGLHAACKAMGSNWQVPAYHPFAVECNRLGQNNPAVSRQSGGGPPSSNSSQGTGSSMLSIDRSTIEQRLSDYERTSTDPNASQMSEMFRSMFLN